MRERINKLHPSHKQLIKFLIVGGIATIWDWTNYYMLTRHTGYFAAHIIEAKALSSVVVSIFGFFMNRYWSFRKYDKVEFFEVVRFYISGSIGIAINVGTTFVGVHYLHIFDMFAVMMATAVTFAWNFSVNKFWVFKK